MNQADFDALSDCLDCTNGVELIEIILLEYPPGETITELFNADLTEVKRAISDVVPNCLSPAPKEITGKIKCRAGESLEQINNRKMKLVRIDVVLRRKVALLEVKKKMNSFKVGSLCW